MSNIYIWGGNCGEDQWRSKFWRTSGLCLGVNTPQLIQPPDVSRSLKDRSVCIVAYRFLKSIMFGLDMLVLMGVHARIQSQCLQTQLEIFLFKADSITRVSDKCMRARVPPQPQDIIANLPAPREISGDPAKQNGFENVKCEGIEKRTPSTMGLKQNQMRGSRRQDSTE